MIKYYFFETNGCLKIQPDLFPGYSKQEQFLIYLILLHLQWSMNDYLDPEPLIGYLILKHVYWDIFFRFTNGRSDMRQ